MAAAKEPPISSAAAQTNPEETASSTQRPVTQQLLRLLSHISLPLYITMFFKTLLSPNHVALGLPDFHGNSTVLSPVIENRKALCRECPTSIRRSRGSCATTLILSGSTGVKHASHSLENITHQPGFCCRCLFMSFSRLGASSTITQECVISSCGLCRQRIRLFFFSHLNLTSS